MKKVIKKILKEEQSTLNLFESNYGSRGLCSRYKNNPQYKKLCLELHNLGPFLYKDIGLKSIIDEKRSVLGVFEDLNDKYQKPLEILYNTGKFKNIEKRGDKFYLPRLANVLTVYDEKGEWSPINKLNTNYADLAELLTELFIRGGVAENLSRKNILGIKSYLTSIKSKLPKVLDKYIDLSEYENFVSNIKIRSDIGERAENEVKRVLESFGMETLYQGGDGDFIDMLFGVDLIMSYKGKPYLIQVKSNQSYMEKALTNKNYHGIDYFASPTNFGIVIKHSSGKETKLNKQGEIIDGTD